MPQPGTTVLPRIERRLAAILAADIAGYSALMGADEEATVRDLKGHQAAVLPMVNEHGGRIIDTAGDGILAEFGSVLNAVRCAVAIQKTMADATVKKKLEELEVQAVYMSARETQKWLEDDVRKFSGIIKEAGLAVK